MTYVGMNSKLQEPVYSSLRLAQNIWVDKSSALRVDIETATNWPTDQLTDSLLYVFYLQLYLHQLICTS